MTVQAIKYEPAGDKVVMTVNTSALIKLGWKHSTGNTPAAYLVGLLAGLKLKSTDIKSVILDLGLQSPKKGSRIYATLKGALDAGLEIPHGEEVIPSADRLSGKHIADHGKVKNAESIVKDFEALKAKIIEG